MLGLFYWKKGPIMEPKIRIGEVAGQGISFAAENLVTAVRLAWPYLVLALISQLIFLENGGYSIQYHSQMGKVVNYPDSWPLFWLAMACYLLSLIVFMPVSVLLYRMAAKQIEAPDGFFYFQWGSRETKLLLATILFFLIVFAAALGAFAPFMLLMAGGMMAGLSGGIANLLMGLGMVAFGFLLIWFLVRTVLILPVAAIEDRVALAAAFNMTKGHFWRLLSVFALLFLALIAAQILIAIMQLVAAVLLDAMGIGIEGISAGGILFTAVALLVGLAVSLVMIGVAGDVWLRLREPVSPNIGSAEVPA